MNAEASARGGEGRALLARGLPRLRRGSGSL